MHELTYCTVFIFGQNVISQCSNHCLHFCCVWLDALLSIWDYFLSAVYSMYVYIDMWPHTHTLSLRVCCASRMSEGAEQQNHRGGGQRGKKKKKDKQTLEGQSAQEVERFPELCWSEICCCYFPSLVWTLILNLDFFSQCADQGILSRCIFLYYLLYVKHLYANYQQAWFDSFVCVMFQSELDIFANRKKLWGSSCSCRRCWRSL